MTVPACQSLLSGRRGRIAAPLFCAIVAVACYANVLENDFVGDDRPIVAENPLVTKAGQWGQVWDTHYWQHRETECAHPDLLYRPVTILSYRINRVLMGPEPFGFHLVNVLLHAVVTALVVRLTWRMTRLRSCAVVTGLVFAVLPIHTEAVASVVGRAELLATLFVLLGLYAFEPRASGGPVGRAARWVAGSAAIFLALASKETGAAGIVLVPLFELYWTRRGSRGPGRHVPRFGVLLAAAVALAAYLPLRYIALGGRLHQPLTVSKTTNVMVDATFWEHVCGAMQLWGMYWARTFWPRRLTIGATINDVQLADSLLQPYAAFGLLVAVGIGWAVIWAWRRGFRAPALWAAALLISYLPVSNTLILIKTFLAERTWYLPSVWGVMLCVWVVCVPALRLHGQGGGRPTWVRLTAAVLGVLMVMLGGARSLLRNAEWRDEETLIRASYRDCPQSVNVMLSYGSWLIEKGRVDEGIALIRKAILIDPGFIEAQRVLGEALLATGDLPGALHHLMIADTQIPGHPPTQALLARVRSALDDYWAAQIEEREAQHRQNPDDLEALLSLADALAQAGRPAEEITRLEASRTRFHDQPRYLHRLAAAYAMAARRGEAVACYRQLRALTAEDPIVAVELAMLLLEYQTPEGLDEADRLTAEAMQRGPNQIPVLIARAEVLALRGRRREAAALYRTLASAIPETAPLHERCMLRAEFLER
ncbi:MAG: hypothetical protein JXB13_16690 [Phycisphaerae bacterium]|nr:hypothetical protein [Phycisphaerae bacterium]